MSKKLLYMTTENVEDIGYVGIRKKVYGQLDCFERNGIESYLIYRNACLNKVVQISKGEVVTEFASFSQGEYYRKVYDFICSREIDVIYIRYIMACENLIDFLKKVKVERNIKVFMEIPTYPYDNILNTNAEPNLLSDREWRTSLKDYVDYLYNYSGYDEIYEMESKHIINGINMENLPLKKNNEDDVFSMLTVSSICRWHGYDRVIMGIYEYKKKNNKRKIQFKIAGQGTALEGLKAIVEKYELWEDVVFLGNVRDDKILNELFDEANVGIGALAFHRVNVTDGSAIKNQEYCARGIPFVTSLNDPNFGEVDFIKCVGSSEEPLDIAEVIEFYEQVNSDENSAKMRQYAQERFTWDTIFSEFVNLVNN